MGRCDLCLEGSLHLGQRRVFVEGGAAEPDRLRRAREQSRSGGHQHRVERDGVCGQAGRVWVAQYHPAPYPAPRSAAPAPPSRLLSADRAHQNAAGGRRTARGQNPERSQLSCDEGSGRRLPRQLRAAAVTCELHGPGHAGKSTRAPSRTFHPRAVLARASGIPVSCRAPPLGRAPCCRSGSTCAANPLRTI